MLCLLATFFSRSVRGEAKKVLCPQKERAELIQYKAVSGSISAYSATGQRGAAARNAARNGTQNAIEKQCDFFHIQMHWKGTFRRASKWARGDGEKRGMFYKSSTQPHSIGVYWSRHHQLRMKNIIYAKGSSAVVYNSTVQFCKERHGERMEWGAERAERAECMVLCKPWVIVALALLRQSCNYYLHTCRLLLVSPIGRVFPPFCWTPFWRESHISC